ncbi:MAG: DUF3299 domain-containing protein [Planctomycetaceae bacterium]|nr:DUF3299 domain-containing protein [Planctomycetaceae bacterium]
MMHRLRRAGLACGVLASWGLAGCEKAELDAPLPPPAVAEESATSATTPPSPAAAPETTAAATSAALPADPRGGATPPAAAAPPPPSRPRAASTARRKPGEVQEITFDDIKFPMEKEDPFKRELLTPQIVALDGQPIRIRGYILPSFQQTGITQFVLVRDNLQCCFGPGAALFDCIIVEMRPGKSTDYTVRPVSVEGKFTLAELVNPDDGKHLAIYHLDGEKVQ